MLGENRGIEKDLGMPKQGLRVVACMRHHSWRVLHNSLLNFISESRHNFCPKIAIQLYLFRPMKEYYFRADIHV